MKNKVNNVYFIQYNTIKKGKKGDLCQYSIVFLQNNVNCYSQKRLSLQA